MILAAAAYMAGLFFASFFSGIAAVLFLLSLAAAVLFIGRLNGLHRCDYIIAAVCFTAAFAYISAYTAMTYDRVTSLDGTNGSYSGEVTAIKDYEGGKSQYILSGTSDSGISVKVQLYTDTLQVGYGDVITVGSCGFSIPEGDYLYGSRARLRSEGVYLTLVSPDNISTEKTNTKWLHNFLRERRERTSDEFRLKMGSASGSFMSSMLFGKASGIDDSTRTALSRCGIAHILAVSGLHVSMIAFMLMWLLRKLRIKRIPAFAVMNLFLFMLVVAAESPVSAIRASIMLDMMYLAAIFRRQNDTFTSLSAAVLLICVFNPYAIYSSGFLISVAGTFGIGVFAPYMVKNMPEDRLLWIFPRAFVTMLCTTLCIMPFSMKYFDETSLISPFTNVFIVPLCTAALAAGVLYFVTGGAISLLLPAKYIIDMILYMSDGIARLGKTHFSAGSERIIMIAFVLASAVGVLQLIFHSRRFTACLTACACSVLFLSSALYGRIMFERFNIAVLGRGSNAAIIVAYKGRTEIIDLSGHYKSPDYVRKYLMCNNISDVDTLVLTKKVQSQYSAYKKALEYIDVDDIYVTGDVTVYGGSIEKSGGSEGFVLESDEYSIQYVSGVLTVDFRGSTMNFIPADKSAENVSGCCICYGNISKNSIIRDDPDVIYLDDEIEGAYNNFEITLSGSGGYKVRRL